MATCYTLMARLRTEAVAAGRSERRPKVSFYQDLFLSFLWIFLNFLWTFFVKRTEPAIEEVERFECSGFVWVLSHCSSLFRLFQDCFYDAIR